MKIIHLISAALTVVALTAGTNPTPSGEFTFAMRDGAVLRPETEVAAEDGFADAARRLGVWWISPGSFVFVAHPVQIWEPATGFWSQRNGFYVGGYFEYDSAYWFHGAPEIHFTADNWDYWRVRALSDHESAHALCWAAGGPNWYNLGHGVESCW